jgi:hypothetical protein
VQTSSVCLKVLIYPTGYQPYLLVSMLSLLESEKKYGSLISNMARQRVCVENMMRKMVMTIKMCLHCLDVGSF